MDEIVKLRPAGHTSPLRVHIVVDAAGLPQWATRAIQAIAEHPGAVLAGVTTATAATSRERPSLLFQLLEWLQNSTFHRHLPLAAAAAPAGREADLTIDLRMNPSPVEGIQTRRWWFHFGDPEKPQRNPPYFWEQYEREPVSHIALCCGDGGGPRVLELHTAATSPGWRLDDNHAVPFGMIPAILERRISDVWARGLDAVESGALPVARPKGKAASPGNISVAAFLARQLGRSLQNRRETAGKELEWFIASRAHAAEPPTEIPAPPGHQFADPFLIEEGMARYLFLEEVPAGTIKGRLAVLEQHGGGAWSQPTVIADEAYHMSYPFVFAHEGDYFMIPETAAANEVALYRALRFPCEWRREKVLCSGIPLVDTTPLWHEGRWYFFTTRPQPGTETYLFSADRLDGEWKYHPQNPVSTDIRRARGAGRIFPRDGKLYRPGQDCSIRYGYALTLNEIVELTPDQYRERPGPVILPDWWPGLRATHTLAVGTGIEILDGSRLRSRSRS